MKQIKLKKGLDIEISGKADLRLANTSQSEIIAICPDDFIGVTPKLAIKEGDQVKAGSPLFWDKNRPEIRIVAPVSGTIEQIARGARRKLLYISIRRDAQTAFEEFQPTNISSTSREDLVAKIYNAGLGAFIKQRPFDVIANPRVAPKAIFISGFDSAPLAPDYNFILKGEGANLQTGLSTLAKLTDGKVFLSVRPDACSELTSAQNVELTSFVGAHPAGNVSVQINNTQPINKGETVWTMNIQDVVMLGKFISTGHVDMTRIVALTGPEVSTPAYYSTVVGASISPIVKGNVTTGRHLRYISGNVLSGTQVAENGYLKPYDAQITVIAEGDEIHEFFGWAMPRFNKFSTTCLYFTKVMSMLGKKKFDFDARILGGERAFIMSGEYEKVFPMDILPEALVKAMIAKNIDKMEQLGAYEVAPEDFALCEFVCTSKIEVQKIVRNALNFMKQEIE